MPARERKQKSVRKGHVKIIVDEMYQRLQSKKHKKRMRNTNRILPPGGLRRAVIRKVFSFWVLEFYGKGRILTKKLATDVCCRLRKKMGLGYLKDEDEITRMHVLLKAARKRQLGKFRDPSIKLQAMSSMDLLETIPMFTDDLAMESCQDRLLVILHVSVFMLNAGHWGFHITLGVICCLSFPFPTHTPVQPNFRTHLLIQLPAIQILRCRWTPDMALGMQLNVWPVKQLRIPRSM
jgi:hypothetical protein